MLVSSPKDTFQGNITFFCLPGQLSNTEGSATPTSSRRPFLCFQMGTRGYSVSFRGILGSSKFNCRVAVSREHMFSRLTEFIKLARLLYMRYQSNYSVI